MIDEHNEIEAKLAADKVAVNAFLEKMFFYGIHQFEIETYAHAIGSDVYYKQGDAVVRHRKDDTAGWQELTVKRRKSATSTRDREEIDLSFADKTAYRSVEAFLLATGFKKVFKLIKDAHIFEVKLTPRLKATFVLYDVWDEANPHTTKRRFIEIEAKKGSDITVQTAKVHVSGWEKELRDEWKLDAALNESLWEIYSGERYQTVT